MLHHNAPVFRHSDQDTCTRMSEKTEDSPDIDVGLRKGREHGGSNAFPGCHLVSHSRQHAAVVNLLHLADAPCTNRLAKPAAIQPHTLGPSHEVLRSEQEVQKRTYHK